MPVNKRDRLNFLAEKINQLDVVEQAYVAPSMFAGNLIMINPTDLLPTTRLSVVHSNDISEYQDWWVDRVVSYINDMLSADLHSAESPQPRNLQAFEIQSENPTLRTLDAVIQPVLFF